MRDILFSTEIEEGIYLISATKKSGMSIEELTKPQEATANSYLVVGDEKTLLFDLAVNQEGLWDYACSLTDKPVQLVLSHGHVDHIFHLNKREEVWLHSKDMDMVRNGVPGVNGPTNPCPVLHPLNEGDVIELGNRKLTVFHIPGHTPGSILLLDQKTRFLLSGDSIARRLLFGVGSEVKLAPFCEKVKQLKEIDFKGAYSAHDRCALPKSHLKRMLETIENAQKNGKKMKIPFVGQFLTYKCGKETEFDYCDVAIYESKRGIKERNI